MKKAIPIDYLYSRYFGKSFYILGAASNLSREIRDNPIPENGITIVLNSSFLVYPAYSIHFIANHEFIFKYSKQFTKKRLVIRPNSFNNQGYEEEFFYYPSRYVASNGRSMIEKNNSLIAAHSCLLPALHFSLRCNPNCIKLYGIDLNTNRHWDSKEKVFRQFPAWRKICQEVKILLSAFDYKNIVCLNDKSLLVTRRIVKYGN